MIDAFVQDETVKIEYSGCFKEGHTYSLMLSRGSAELTVETPTRIAFKINGLTKKYLGLNEEVINTLLTIRYRGILGLEQQLERPGGFRAIYGPGKINLTLVEEKEMIEDLEESMNLDLCWGNAFEFNAKKFHVVFDSFDGGHFDFNSPNSSKPYLKIVSLGGIFISLKLRFPPNMTSIKNLVVLTQYGAIYGH